MSCKRPFLATINTPTVANCWVCACTMPASDQWGFEGNIGYLTLETIFYSCDESSGAHDPHIQRLKREREVDHHIQQLTREREDHHHIQRLKRGREREGHHGESVGAAAEAAAGLPDRHAPPGAQGEPWCAFTHFCPACQGLSRMSGGTEK